MEPLNDMVDSESVVDISPGDCDMVLRYLIDEFTHIWSAEHFVAQSHISPGSQIKCQFSPTSHFNCFVRTTPF